MAKKKKQASPDDFLNWLITGGPGSGKTTSLAYLAQFGKVIYCDAESGFKSRPLQRRGIELKNIDIRRIGKFDHLDRVYRDSMEMLADRDPPFAIVHDTMTEMTATFVDEVVGGRVKRLGKAGTIADWDTLAGRDDYKIVTNRFRRYARKMRDFPAHTGWTAHVRRRVDDDGETLYLPNLMPVLGDVLMGFMDLMTYHLEFEDQHVALGKPRGKYREAVKDRLDIMPTVLANPTADRVLALFDEKLDLSKDPDQKRYLKAARRKR